MCKEIYCPRCHEEFKLIDVCYSGQYLMKYGTDAEVRNHITSIEGPLCNRCHYDVHRD